MPDLKQLPNIAEAQRSPLVVEYGTEPAFVLQGK
jgi:hypothetical protein